MRYCHRQDLLAGQLHPVGFPRMPLGGDHDLVVVVAPHYVPAIAVQNLCHGHLL
jgi:hypothetical protein